MVEICNAIVRRGHCPRTVIIPFSHVSHVHWFRRDSSAPAAKHGDCSVNSRSGKLGRWVATQREHYVSLKKGNHSCIARN
mmetsp:Transcript_30993/g.45385  ORF Transcript_30993/g.45385 Transcript_30993/m.45385 type:complete len:80 (-) Transcript_30993:48-287(-)